MAATQTAMRRRARIMRAVNVPMRAALSLPFATPLSGNLMLISHTGRKSGKAYRQPVSYVRDVDRAAAHVAHLLRDPGDSLADAGLGLGGGIGRLDGLLAGTERVHLRRQVLRGDGELLLLRLQRSCWPCKCRFRDVTAARRVSASRARSSRPAASDLPRLALQLGCRLLQLGELKLDALAAGRHVRHPAAHLLQQLQLPLVGVVEHLAGILGAVERLIRLGPEQRRDAAHETHPIHVPSLGRRLRHVRRPGDASEANVQGPGEQVRPAPLALGSQVGGGRWRAAHW